MLLKLVMLTPVLFNVSSERGNIDFLGIVVAALSSTIDTSGLFLFVILPSLSVGGPGVSNLLARLTFSPLLGK